MEIKSTEQRPKKRGRLIVILVLAVVALIVSIWQYHSLVVEVSGGVSTDLYQQVVHKFKGEGSGNLAGHSLRVALLRSESTASSFGERRDNYYGLIRIWQKLLDDEGFGYKVVTEVPEGDEIAGYNLLVLPSASCLSAKQRSAVKAFLKAGKGVVMTWACGTRNEYGQWERYSLLQEIGGMDVEGEPPEIDNNISVAMLAGGYPITASTASGFHLDIMRYNSPVLCHVREERVMIDGVWMDKQDSSFGLHSVRGRAAVTHGEYLGGRFVWLGFSIGSCHETAAQHKAFFGLFRHSALWAGHQVQAFKPVWQGEKSCVVAVTQNILGPEDIKPDLMALYRRHRMMVTSFVAPEVVAKYPDKVKQLAAGGEVGLLGDPALDYRTMTQGEQERAFKKAGQALKAITGYWPYGFRTAPGRGYNDDTLYALVREGYEYFSNEKYDRLVPKAVRSYRKVALVTRPRLLWQLPEMKYIKDAGDDSDNTMLSHYAQISALNGLYCLSFRPSEVERGFAWRLDNLLERVKRDEVMLATTHGVISAWADWDQVKMSTRYISDTRTLLKISNTGRRSVKNIVMYIELPRITSRLDIEAMALGTELPSRKTHDGIRWKLYLDKLSGGKNVTYYLDLPRYKNVGRAVAPAKSSGD